MNKTAYFEESEGYAIARGWASIQDAPFPSSSIPEFNNAQWREACNNLFNGTRISEVLFTD